MSTKGLVTWTCLLALGFQNTCLCVKIGFLPVLMLDITNEKQERNGILPLMG